LYQVTLDKLDIEPVIRGSGRNTWTEWTQEEYQGLNLHHRNWNLLCQPQHGWL